MGRNLSWKAGQQDGKILINALCRFVCGELDNHPNYRYLERDIKFHWENSHLWITKTKLSHLCDLTEYCEQRLDAERVRNVLLCLERLNILQDQRGSTHSRTKTGSSIWQFVLKFPNDSRLQILNWLFGNSKQPGEWERRYQQLKGQKVSEISPDFSPINSSRHDWGNVDGAIQFCGRKAELNCLTQWGIEERCRVIGLIGLGGIGKTSLTVEWVKQHQNQFELLWMQSLRNAPPFSQILADCLRFLSGSLTLEIPEETNQALSLLLSYLTQHRCLIVIDNLESILQQQEYAGHYRDGYEDYGELLQRLARSSHQSCLLFTSREPPQNLIPLHGENSPVRLLKLSCLRQSDAVELLTSKGLSGTDEEFKELIESYEGHPLALELIVPTIQNVCDGNIRKFLTLNLSRFQKISDILTWHIDRLSAVEKQVMYGLGIHQDGMTLEELQGDLEGLTTVEDLIMALESLLNRSLIQKTESGFKQQSVIEEYICDRFLKTITIELIDQQLNLFYAHPLIKATAKDYIRENQVRTILKPLQESLINRFGSLSAVTQHLQQILTQLKTAPRRFRNYAGGNLINLCISLEIDLRGYDFSELAIWQGFFRTVELHQVNFSQVEFKKSVFAEQLSNLVTVCFNANGQWLAAGDRTGEIHIWQVATGEKICTLKSHHSIVRSVAFHPSEDILASGGDDDKINLWRVPQGERIQSWMANCDRVNCLIWTADGGTLISSGFDQTIQLWKMTSDHPIPETRLTGHQDHARAVAISPNGRILASVSSDKILRIWDIAQRECLAVLQEHQLSVYTVAYHPNGELLATAGADKTVKLWDVRDPQQVRCVATLIGHQAEVSAVAFSPDGQRLASGSYDQTVILWEIGEIENCQILTVCRGHGSWIHGIAWSCEGILASAGDAQTVKLWEGGTGQPLATWQSHSNGVDAIAVSPDQKTFVSGGSDLRVWDLHSGQVIKTLSRTGGRVWALAFSPDGKQLVTAGDERVLRVWDMETGHSLRVLRGHRHRVRSLAVHPQGRRVVSGSRDGSVKVWDLHTGECLQSWEAKTDLVYGVAVSPDGLMVAHCGDRYSIQLRGFDTGEVLQVLSGHQREINALAFSPDGRYLASGSGDHHVRLWDVRQGECVAVFKGHNNWVFSVAFRSDSGLLASCGGDQCIYLWDTNNFEAVGKLSSHQGWVCSGAFSSNGKLLVTGGTDETVKVWSVVEKRCLQTLVLPKLYQELNITGVRGLNEGVIATLKGLGAVE